MPSLTITPLQIFFRHKLIFLYWKLNSSIRKKSCKIIIDGLDKPLRKVQYINCTIRKNERKTSRIHKTATGSKIINNCSYTQLKLQNEEIRRQLDWNHYSSWENMSRDLKHFCSIKSNPKHNYYNVTVLSIDFGDKNYDGISIDNKTTNFNFGSLISARNV